MKMIQRVERVMAERGIKQGELERSLGLSTNRISKWKGGQGEPTARQALKIARALAVPLEWLVSEDGPLDPPTVTAVAEFSPEERAVALVFRNARLDVDEAFARLLAPAVAPEAAPAPKAASRRRQS